MAEERKNKGRYMSDEGFLELRAAVVAKACSDYANLNHDKGYAKSMLERERLQKLKDLKAWFHSRAFHFWCDYDPDLLMEQMDKNAKNGFIFHSYWGDEDRGNRIRLSIGK